MNKLLLYDDVVKLLIEHGELKGEHFIESRQPTHGPCCTCQTCGYYHDECVCYHNELLYALQQLILRQD